jgi:hypothetical protein
MEPQAALQPARPADAQLARVKLAEWEWPAQELSALVERAQPALQQMARQPVPQQVPEQAPLEPLALQPAKSIREQPLLESQARQVY